MRFTLRSMMIAVVIAAATLAVIAALMPRAPSAWTPRDAAEALTHATQTMRTRKVSYRLEDCDAEVRRIPADTTNLGRMYGGLFQVCFIQRDAGGLEVDRDCYVIIPGGYCMARTRVTPPGGGKSQLAD